MTALRSVPGRVNEVGILSGDAVKGGHFIHQAAFFGKKEIVAELLQLGADPLRQTYTDKSLMDMAGEGHSQGLWDESAVTGDPCAWFRGVYDRALSYRAAGMDKVEYANAVAQDLHRQELDGNRARILQ